LLDVDERLLFARLAVFVGDEPRLTMLETVREDALERLQESGN
jgi:hypothetical protein